MIATGGSPVIPDIPGTDINGVMPLKNLDDGRKIKTYLRNNNVKKVVIIGMGYIGIEMCEAFRKRDIEVDMIKPGTVFLPWMAAELSERVKKELESNNVRLHLGHKIDKIEKTSKNIKVVCEDISIDADMVLIAMGIKPNSELALKAGITLSIKNSIAVDRMLKTSDENIYAAGDCADAYHVITGEKTWIPLALIANRAGWAAADNICGKKTEITGVSGTAVFKIFYLEAAHTGLDMKEAAKFGFEPEQVVITTRSRAHAHPGSSPILIQMIGDKKTGSLLGAQMVGQEGAAHRIDAVAVALYNKMTVEAFSQTDLAYAPPFSPVWDPLLTAANQLIKKI